METGKRKQHKQIELSDEKEKLQKEHEKDVAIRFKEFMDFKKKWWFTSLNSLRVRMMERFGVSFCDPIDRLF
jgi:hypothetical protein